MSSETITRNDLKDILDAILPYETVKTEETASTLSYHSSKMRFTRQGNVVTCRLYGTFTSLPNGGYTSAGQTVPSGFRPNDTMFARQLAGATASVNILLRIDADGAISFYNYSGSVYSGNGYFDCAYIIR